MVEGFDLGGLLEHDGYGHFFFYPWKNSKIDCGDDCKLIRLSEIELCNLNELRT